LPTDPDEQRRIAELLRAADDAVEAWRGVENALDRIRESRMNDWFDVSRVQADSAWRQTRLDEFATLQTGVALGKSYDGAELESLPYLRVANVQDGHLDLGEMKEISVPKSDVKRYKVRAGDVLMNEGGDFDKLGRGAVWRGEIDPCLHQNHVFCIRPIKDKLSSDFLAIQAESPHGKRYFLRCAKKTTNLASINSSQVRAFPLLWADLPIQLGIVKEFEELARSIQNAHERISSSRNLLQHLSHYLLTPPLETPRCSTSSTPSSVYA
jgi:type I restriction enzyme, S subunit